MRPGLTPMADLPAGDQLANYLVRAVGNATPNTSSPLWAPA
jgi:hypothetical protein